MFDLVLKNVKLVNGSGELCIAIENGKIAEISKLPPDGDVEIDLKGQYVLPGLIDPHVHFRDPGLTYKEDFKSGSMAAAHGGFTFVMDMPNTKPITNTYKSFKEKLGIAERKSCINFGLHAGHNTLEEMEKIASLNPMSFKVFMDLESDESLDEIFANVAGIDGNPIITVHAENRKIVQEETKRLEDSSNPIDYSYARPAEAEIVSIKQAISLSKKYGNNLHICHLSTKKAMDLAVSNGVSFEFTPHHLLFDNSQFNKFGTIVKTNPPLREMKDKVSISGIDENSIIGTDHAPHSLDEKTRGAFSSASGIPALETVLPLLLREVNRGRLALDLIPRIFSENAARRFNLEGKGFIKEGFDADLTVVDLSKEGRFDIEDFYTKAEYSPFDGFEYKGMATRTIVGGKIVMEDGEVFTS